MQKKESNITNKLILPEKLNLNLIKLLEPTTSLLEDRGDRNTTSHHVEAISFLSLQSYLRKAFIFLFCYTCRKVLKNTSNKDVSKITKNKKPSSTQTPSARAGQLSG